MVEFGKHLEANREDAWAESYIRYEMLKDILKSIEEAGKEPQPGPQGTVSLSLANGPVGLGAAADAVTENHFFSALEEDMRKVQRFTKNKMNDLLAEIDDVSRVVDSLANGASAAEDVLSTKRRLQKLAEKFLRLEKFVNLNFTGFDKILKKHDKVCPTPCREHYINRLASQPWVRGDYSGVMVSMSRMWEKLRGDRVVEEVKSDMQNFTRRTTKYWVRTEDVTAVKARVLMHLPVFLQESMKGESDAQLVNSIYLDNTAMELYRGRLNKTPGAIALRLRWYGTATPDSDGRDGMVFVERKTHLDKWTGGLSVKERFMLPASRIPELFNGTFDIEGEIAAMRSRGKTEAQIDAWRDLAEEIYQTITSKQLVPTMRTQCYRTAFQIPFDATVRISIDTNLAMVAERTDEAVQVASTGKWFRDPRAKVPQTQITRFPHAILEVKLQLEDGQEAPAWVDDLLNSGLAREVHKYSKFVHGCAVLMLDDVPSVPYWVDDPSLEASIRASGGDRLLEGTQNFRDANSVYSHLLPFRDGYHVAGHPGAPALRAVGSETRAGEGVLSAIAGCVAGDGTARRFCRTCIGYVAGEDSQFAQICFADDAIATPSHQKVEPKILFANERTFLKWLQMAVSLSGLSTALLAFRHETHAAHTYAMIFLPVALCFAAYGLNTWRWRGHRIRSRVAGRWDDALGPTIMGVTLILALSLSFAVHCANVRAPRA